MEITQAFALLIKATQKWNYPGYRRLLEIKYKSFSQFLVLKRDLCVSSKSFLGGIRYSGFPDTPSFEANFLSLSEQAICLKDLYLLMEGDGNLFLY